MTDTMTETAKPGTAEDLLLPSVSRPDKPFDGRAAAGVEIEPGKGVLIRDLPQMVEAAKLMAAADVCVPPHCRGKNAVCFAILYKTNALSLKDPFFVADHSYVVRQKRRGADGKWEEVETLAFDSAIFHAAVEVSGILKGPLRCEFDGEGLDRTCTVFGTFRSEEVPHELTSPPLGRVHPGKNEAGFVKGSPLWDKDPDQQLFYWTVRNWARRYCPHVVGGIYDKDEFEETPLRDVTPATPKLMERLPGRMEGQGFAPEVVENGLKDAVDEVQTKPKRKRKARAD